jgi:hypothetical protein
MFNNNNEGKSSTKTVNIYGMPKQGKLKKTGLGDTDGIKRDK